MRIGSLKVKIAPIQILGNPLEHLRCFGTLASNPAARGSEEVMNASRCSLMPGCCPAVATFALHCPPVLLYPLHLPVLYRKAILEPAKFSNVDLFLIPLPVITSCRSYLMYLRQPDVTDGGTEIASTSTKIKCFNYFA